MAPWEGLPGAVAQRVLAPRATGPSTASIMFAANVTLGLYIHFGPKPVAPNNTMGLESVPLGGAEQPLATPTTFLTLVPLLATMLFITGRCGGWGRGCQPGREGCHGREWRGVAVSWAGHCCPGWSGGWGGVSQQLRP